MNLLDDCIPYEPQPLARVWSGFQQAVFDSVTESNSNLLIQAVAGSGKTTTIIEAMRFAGSRPLFMAFNKAIADDIRRRAPAGEVKTLNALGHWMWQQNEPRAVLDSKKTLLYLRKVMGEDSFDYKEFGWTMSRVIGLAKNCCVPPTSHSTLDIIDIIDSYGMEIPADRVQSLAAICSVVLEQGFNDRAIFDFDDQLYVPVMDGWVFPTYSDVFVDECQDLSPVQHAMLSCLASKGARIIAVGDRHQAIYGFRGALVDSMDKLKRQFNMTELPLSISYRCPKSVVAEAQVLCPTIRHREDAPEGKVIFNERDPDFYKDREMIICRNNAPLFRNILKYIRARKPCEVRSNFIDSFQGFIRGFKCKSTSELIPKLEAWFEKETAAANAKGFAGKAFGIKDKYETAVLLAKEFGTVEALLDAVKRLSLGATGPIFSTIHKAKGLESNSVYLLRPDLIPAFYAVSKEQRQQEDNLLYVAITRSQNELTYGEMA
jgi:hypothetical protein